MMGWLFRREPMPTMTNVQAWREVALTTAFNRHGTTQIQYLDSFIDEAAARAAQCSCRDDAIFTMAEAFKAYERECPLELATPIEWAAADCLPPSNSATPLPWSAPYWGPINNGFGDAAA